MSTINMTLVFIFPLKSTVNGLAVSALTTYNRADSALFRRRHYCLSEGVKTPRAGLIVCGYQESVLNPIRSKNWPCRSVRAAAKRRPPRGGAVGKGSGAA